jgi:tungstate transport system substrate-binding protein
MMQRFQSATLPWSLLLIVLALVACGTENRRLRLATTTTTVDSGLIAAILPFFEQEHDAAVDVIAVGTGEALTLGRAGDVDVVLVHARSLEEEFVKSGYGLTRREVMYNDFVLIGPADDPAGISGMADVTLALSRVREAESPFISRGDQSGTHIRERELWSAQRISPEGDWYREVGQGMGATLTVANEVQGYTISDRATYVARRSQGLELVILVEGDRRLSNPYGVITVNPAIHEDINDDLAEQFANWITSAETQAAIDRFRVDGRQVFFGSPGG